MIRTGALRDMDTIDLRQVESKSDLLTKFLVFINKDEQYALQRRYISHEVVTVKEFESLLMKWFKSDDVDGASCVRIISEFIVFEPRLATHLHLPLLHMAKEVIKARSIMLSPWPAVVAYELPSISSSSSSSSSSSGIKRARTDINAPR
jgi:hypothetical protein